MSKKSLLTFEISNDHKELDIHCDRIGLASLLRILHRLEKADASQSHHEHLMTESWGGNELTEDPQSEGGDLINKVTIRLWN